MNAANEFGEALDTPVMRQYLEIKRAYPDCVLLFRMGDFYEMFMEDAVRAAPVLDVALTRRQNAIPMAGVPYHSVDTYLARLIAAGIRVAIAEQTIDPANPKLMKRVVARVVSPGTVIEEALLPESSHSYIAACLRGEGVWGVALADVATGDFSAFEVPPDDLESFLFSREVREILCRASDRALLNLPGLPAVHPLEEWKAGLEEGARQIEQKFSVKPGLLGFAQTSVALGACGLAIHYLSDCFPGAALPVPAPVFKVLDGETMLLDEETIRNLELLESARGGEDHTLFSVLNHAATAAGRRRLREILISPLCRQESILPRLDSVEWYVEKHQERVRTAQVLSNVRDLERILTRLSRGRGGPQDFRSVQKAVAALYDLQGPAADLAVRGFGQSMPDESILLLSAEIERVVVEEPPAVIGGFGFVKTGVRDDLDFAARARAEGAQWILAYEEEEKAAAKIPLKIKYNRVHGYYIEVTKSNTSSVPAHFKRRQTLLSAERYTTERLIELEEKIQGADVVIERAEKEEFERLSELVLEQTANLKKVMLCLAAIDAASSLAAAAVRFQWVRPEFTAGGFSIVDGRHPVVEAHLAGGDVFTPNSLSMDEGHTLAILTGPNMAGKSTFIRQTALIQLLAQIGSFVPAKQARLPLSDGIYTRIGASDNLSRGESTFFVEMLETARILRRAGRQSLVILDEVGRGTSTYDGLSIAWAIVEALTGEARPTVLFATHYHELTALEHRPGVFNLTMDVREIDGKIHFLRKVREGAADRSYGIHVAELAGIPQPVIRRAREKLSELESRTARKPKTVRMTKDPEDYSLFNSSE